MPVDFTVIIATRNRMGQLDALLQDLRAQETGGCFAHEVIVADNGSTDGTRGVVERHQPTFPVPLRYLYEGRPGKPWALNAGMREAQGQLFAFTDDDMQVTPKWLQALWVCFKETGADAIMGRILPSWLNGKPEWLTDELFWADRLLGCVDYGPNRFNSQEKENHLWVGGNIAIRRSVYERMGGYDIRMTRGQDTEYCYRAIRHQCKIIYEPESVTFHKIPGERTTVEYFRQWSHRTGYYEAYLIPWKFTHLLTLMPLSRYGKVCWLLKQYFRSKFSSASWGRQFCYELWFRQELSMWAHRLQLWPHGWLTVFTKKHSLSNCVSVAAVENEK